MAEKYFLFSLDDNKTKKLGEVISNPTSKKIANLLAEKELSESDLSKALNIPLNTVEYNLKKLIETGIAEKSKEYFWSAKGKKIPTYKIANKLIVISPKKSNIYSKLKGLVPLVLSSAVFTAFIVWYQKAYTFDSKSQASSAPEMLQAAQAAAQPIDSIIHYPPFLNMFLISIWVIIAVFVVYTLVRKKE